MTIPQAFTLALEHHQAGRLADAEALYRQILAVQPNHAEALHHLGILAHRMGRNDLAVEWIRQAVVLNPNNPFAYSNLGEACRMISRFDEAIASFHRAIALQPGHAEFHNNLGAAFAERGQFDEAIAAYHRAIALKSDFAAAYSNLAGVLWKQGQLDEAVAAYLRAIQLRPDYADAHNNLGSAFTEQGQFDQAAAAYRQALQIEPDLALAKFNLSLLLLRSGDYEQGLPLFEARWDALHYPKRHFPQPRWDGRMLDGQRVLIHAEQGSGDSIQFIRYAQLIAARGGEVIVECQPSLTELFRSTRDVRAVIAAGDALPPFDLHVPVLSQPLVFQTTLESIPREVPYLFADPVRHETWRRRIGGAPSRLKVGLAWAGDPKQSRDRIRSIPLRHLLPLIRMEGVDFFSVQKGHGAAEIRELPEATRLIDHTGHLHDFADTAAFLTELDLVISVDTSVAHLAGALGRPVWTLLSFVADWRWGTESEKTAWYPTMRLFRQAKAGDWEEVVERVATALRERSALP